MRRLYFFLFTLTQVSSSTLKVIGFFGHNVTLPCMYDSLTHGVLSFCWGRGMVPRSQCSNTILSSQDGAEHFRQSPRYQLLGRVTDGDVSLTILDAQWSDAGVYGCRIEIPGWFNDKKINTYLVIEEDTLTTLLTNKVEVGETIGITTAEEKIKAGNIGRLAAIFFFIIIITLVFVFRRRFLPKRTLQHLNNSTAENIYEVL
ncbi:T-cell immunoglobulin and mucin domain-containing protein 4-like isoform X2 [Etheostoma cragini]|uniref:T-cell immunoglobulin and mucin domain-containing protein 4-like isoform X2 n=1 Tax=Etheostoma cragini TaxID=417921 RepID=UPI00155E25E6|nr:T-cell immunoglobulin and mucin domain-containing protein 4-like isoform X2 [Etheostoma cragini]